MSAVLTDFLSKLVIQENCRNVLCIYHAHFIADGIGNALQGRWLLKKFAGQSQPMWPFCLQVRSGTER